MSLLAKTAFAQVTFSSVASSNPTLMNIVNKITDAVITPAVLVMFVVATIVFMWGVYQLIAHADDPKARSDGQQRILWGVIGMFIMMGAYGIIILIANSTGQVSPFN